MTKLKENAAAALEAKVCLVDDDAVVVAVSVAVADSVAVVSRCVYR